MMENYSLLTLESMRTIAVGAVSFEQNPRFDGISYRVAYPNGYGASIIKFAGSYGSSEDLWEVAVLEDDDLCYDTYLTDDVLGYLTEEEVVALCAKIYSL